MQQATDVQKETLKFIMKYTRENGFSPSQREIADARCVQLKAVADCLTLCEKKGYIKRAYGVARSICVTEKGENAAYAE